MSYISLLLPAFHLNTTDINDIKKYCSNQFNLTTRRYTLGEIEEIYESDEYNKFKECAANDNLTIAQMLRKSIAKTIKSKR